MHSYQKFKYSYINDNFRKSIKNITKGIIKIHYTTFQANQSLLFLINVVCLADKQQCAAWV
jgi:hypothetical protein